MSTRPALQAAAAGKTSIEDPIPVDKVNIPSVDFEDKGWCTTKRVGKYYYECKSKRSIFGIPLFHFVSLPIHPGTKNLSIANGIVAIGFLAFGFLALGAFAVGAVAIGILAGGFIAAIGNAAVATVAVLGNAVAAIGWALGNAAVAYRVSANAGAEF